MPLIDDLQPALTDDEIERRRFLGRIGAGALGIATAGTAITTVQFLEPNVLFEEASRYPIGRPAEIAPGTVLVLRKQKIYVVRTQEGLYALSSTCTHLGCMTRYMGQGAGFFCPCHGSRFTLDGKVTDGPAPRPLPRLALTVEDGVLWVDTNKRVALDSVLEVPA